MTIVRANLGLVALLTFLLSSVSTAQNPTQDIYFARQIWLGNGQQIENGAMVVADGKIVSIGPRTEISIPVGAVRHDFDSYVIIPGLIAAQTNLSGTTTEERTLTPGIRALDGFDFFADRNQLLKSGITTVQVSPGNDRLMPGLGGVVQLAGDDISDRVLSEVETLRIVLSSSSRNPPRIYEPPVGPVSEDRPLEPTRPQFETLTASLAGLRQIFKQAIANETFVSNAEPDQLIETLAQLIKQKTPIRITATTAPEIRGAVSLAKEFNLSIILVDCVGLEPFAKSFDSWKRNVKGVVLAGLTPGKIDNPSPEEIETGVEPWEYARELIDAGIPVAIRAGSDTDLERLMFVAGQFMRDNLSRSELLSAITRTPAELMGVADQVGSLEAGKIADFVVLDSQPFELHTRIMGTYAAGKPVYESKHETATKIVKADRVYMGDGHYLDGANVVVKGKTVRGVGSSASAPQDAEVKSFGNGAVIVPGFVDLGSGLGLGGPLSGTVTLQTKLGEQLYPDDPAIGYARKNGITTALLSSNSGSASPVVAFKLGNDVRVVADPVAIRFKLDGDTATAIATNEKLLKAAKAYVDSWEKYEKDLAEYEVKVKEAAAKVPAKTDTKPEAEKPEAEKKDTEKKEAEKPTDKKQPEEKKDPDKKETGDKKDDQPADKPEKKEEKKEAAQPDPITGTWEGELQSDRLPPQIKAFKFELVLEGDKVSGSVDILRSESEIVAGSFNQTSRELSITLERRGAEIAISGTLDGDGNFAGTIDLGRMGTVDLTASRTVDKSKKPEPKPKDEPKPGDEKKDKPEGKDKPADQDKPKEGDKPVVGDKPKEGEKPEPKDEKKDGESEDKDQKKPEGADEKAAGKPADKAEELKPPKKPTVSEALEPYKKLFSREIPAIVESRDLNSIKATAELFSKTYNLRTIILGANDLARQPDLLQGYDVSICTGPTFSVTVDKNPPTNLPQLIANEQLPFGFQSGGTTGAGQLPSAVQYVVSQGLSTTDALSGLTANPARMLSADSNFGCIAAGKDADLVVLSGPPFEFSTKVLAVMIDGDWVYEREEQK